MAKRSSTGSTVAKVLGILALVIVILLVVAEIGLRMFVAHEVRSGFEESNPQADSQEKVDVSFGAVPLLLGVVSGKINEFSMRTPSTLQIDGDNVAGNPPADITLDGVKLDDNMTADTVHVVSDIPDDFLLATIRTQIAQNMPESVGVLAEYLTITDLTSDPSTNTINVQFAQGAASLALTPSMQNGQLGFTAERAEILGFDLPSEITDQITQGLQEGLANEVNTGGLQMEGFELIDGGVRMTMNGQNIPLRELNQVTDEATQPAS